MVVPYVHPFQDPEENKILQLDDEMHNVLTNKKLQLSEKMSLYRQTLTKFLRMYNKSLPSIPHVEMSNDNEEDESEPDESHYQTTIEPKNELKNKPPKSEPIDPISEPSDPKSEPINTSSTGAKDEPLNRSSSQPMELSTSENLVPTVSNILNPIVNNNPNPNNKQKSESDRIYVDDLMTALNESVAIAEVVKGLKKAKQNSIMNLSQIPVFNDGNKLNITDNDLSVLAEVKETYEKPNVWEQPKNIFFTETYAPPPAPYVSRTRKFTMMPNSVQKSLEFSFADQFDNFVTKRTARKTKNKIPIPPPLSESIFKKSQPTFKIKTKRKNATIKSSAKRVQESIRIKELFRPVKYQSNHTPLWEDINSLYGKTFILR
jgi:hypothetical protein